MQEYSYLFVREQRARITFSAASREEAQRMAEQWADGLELCSRDDESDDRGELLEEEEQ